MSEKAFGFSIFDFSVVKMLFFGNKKLYRRLRESEERLSLALSLTQIGIWDWEVAKDAWYASPTYFTMMGYEPEEGPSDRGIWLKRVHPDDREAVRARIMDVLKYEKEEYEYEARMLHADGSYRWHHVVGCVVKRDAQGNILRMTGVRRDIHEKKCVLEQLDAHRKGLEAMVEIRTQELAQSNNQLRKMNDALTIQRDRLLAALRKLRETKTQLVESEKMASLGVLSAGIAHEVNNPLNYILGGSTSLEHYLNQNAVDDLVKVRPFLNTIKEGVERASAIVRSLTHYARRDGVEKTDCDIHFILNNCLLMMQGEIHENIKLEKHLADQPVIVHGNEGKLHQAFLNIIKNAVQSMPGGGVIKVISNSYPTRIIVEVEDSGTGMDENTKKQIFDPFFTTKAPGEGTGLGLSITYSVIQDHGGHIKVWSEQGKGTKMTITLPRPKAHPSRSA